jgi:hypothetical protein
MTTNETIVGGAVVRRETFDLGSNRYRLFEDIGDGLVLVTDRALTAGEASDLTADANANAVETRLRDALAANKTFLAIASPTNAQTLAQVKALTRQVSALIRKAAGDYRDIEA